MKMKYYKLYIIKKNGNMEKQRQMYTKSLLNLFFHGTPIHYAWQFPDCTKLIDKINEMFYQALTCTKT